MPCPGYLQPLTDAAFGTPFTRVTDPRPADAAGDLSQAGLLHASLFQLTGVERGSEPVADRQRLFRLLTSASPTTPNTLINAAPAMVLATAPVELCSGGSLVPGHSHHLHLRIGAGSDHLTNATTKAMLKVRSRERTAAT